MTKLTTWQATIQDDDTGAAIVSPVVTIRLGGPAGALADLFDLVGAPIANPVTGGLDGFVQVQMRPGRYWVQANDGGTFSNAWYIDVMPEEGLSWATRAELVVDVAAGMNLPDGTVVSDGTVQYVASAGATAIGDMPGWVPFGDVYADHFAANTTPGTTDMASAANSALAYSKNVRLRGQKYLFGSQVSVPVGGSLTGPETLAKRRLNNDSSFIDDEGAIIFVNFGNGITEATPATYYANAAIEMNDATSVRGISFWYPGIDVSVNAAPTAYPPAITTVEDVRGVTIENVNLGNAYVGIDATRDNRNVTIRNIIGFPVYRGIITGSGATPIEISRVTFIANNILAGSPWINPSNNIAVWVQGNGYGIELRRTTWSNFVDCFFFGYARGFYLGVNSADAANGINISGSPQNVNIRGCGFDTCPVGIYGDEFQGRLVIEQCMFAPNQNAGYSLSPAPSFYRGIHLAADAVATVTDVSIDKCRFWDVREDAIYMLRQDESRVSGCHIDDVGNTLSGVGIHLDDCKNSVVDGNRLNGQGNANTSQGIVLEGNCQGSVVSGNIVREFDSYPIRLDTTDYTVVSGNTGESNTLSLITDTSGTKKYFNKFRDNRDDKGSAYSDSAVSGSPGVLTFNVVDDLIRYTGTTSFSGITHGREGDVVTIRFSAACTITDDDAGVSQENRLFLAGNFTTTFGDTITLRSLGSLGWFEMSRSVN